MSGSDTSEGGNEPIRVLEAPVEAAEPLAETVEQPAPRVIKHETVQRLNRLAGALDEAVERAERIVAEAREEAETIRREAREEGRQEGCRELVDLIAQVRERYRNLQDEAQRDMLDLAFGLARRIIGREVERDPEIVREMIAQTLEHVRGKRQVVAYVHPDDLPYVDREREKLSRRLDGATIFFEADAEVERGGCLIETATERVDARLEMQLRQLKEAVAD